MKKVIVEHQQSILDLALEVYGKAEDAFELAIANGLSLTDSLEPSLMLSYNENTNPIAGYFASKKYHPATELTLEQDFKQEGIDFWIMEDDFVVQAD